MSARSTRRFILLAIVLGAASASTAIAQDIRFKFEGETAGEALGTCVDGGGDANGDGVPDMLVGAPMHVESGKVVGRVHVYSGVDGAELLKFDASVAGTGLGFSTRFAGDVDLDGHDDVLVGFKTEGTFGVARVFSGADGSLIWEWFGVKQRDNFGGALDGVGDLNADGYPELLVGSHTTNARDVGSISVYSGIDGTELRRHTGGFDFGHFGIALAGIGDANGDGIDDYIVGEANSASNGTDSGSAYVYSGFDGSLLWNLLGDAGDEFGSSVDGCGDVDSDGAADFVVGAPLHEASGAPTDSGSVFVYSGASGALILQFDGIDMMGKLGSSVRGTGDVNGDGVPDVLIGSAFEDTVAGVDAGRVRLYSGLTGFLLHPFDLGAAAGAEFGFDVCGAGDTDGDGFIDLFFGAPGETTTAGTGAGAAYLCRGEDLFLEPRPIRVLAGQPVNFFSRGMLPNDQAAIYLLAIDGVPMLTPLALGVADNIGTFRFTSGVPVSLRGHNATVQSYAVTTRGNHSPGIDSIQLTVTFH